MSENLQTRAVDLAPLVSIVTDTLISPHSRRAYAYHLRAFLQWVGDRREPFSRGLVMSYRAVLTTSGAGSSKINMSLNAIRKLALEAADRGYMPAGEAAAIAQVPGVRKQGRRTGYWLTIDQARALLGLTAGTDPTSMRDRVILGLLMGAGLRRQEAVDLTCGQVQERDGHAVLVDVLGKGQKLRTVPLPDWAAEACRAWVRWRKSSAAAFLLCRVDHAKKPTPRKFSTSAIRLIVVEHGKALGLPETLDPHDLRRTFAKLAMAGRADLDQIQAALGHASLQTTQRYLGVNLDLTRCACDAVGL